MCGIGLLVVPEGGVEDSQASGTLPLHQAWPSVLHNIHRRGPDSHDTVHHNFTTTKSESWNLYLTSTVLSLRGDGITSQPLESPGHRLALAWNGQIFDWDTTRATTSKKRLDAGENDGRILLDRIKQHVDDGAGCEEALNTSLSEIEAPYAFVLLDKQASKVWFGRDPLGRRSLLLHQSKRSEGIAIVSVASEALVNPETTLTQIPCSSIWTLDFGQDPTTPHSVPRLASSHNSHLLLRELRQPSSLQNSTQDPNPADVRSNFLDVLSNSVKKRVTNINTAQPINEAHVAILFSGGLDCTTLALLADKYVPKEQPIDLLNVGFENVRALAAAKLENEKRHRSHAKAASMMNGKGKRGKDGRADYDDIRESNLSTLAAMERSIGQVKLEEDEEDALASDIYLVPDRVTGLSSYDELRRLAPDRQWNFVQINVPYAEYNKHKPTVSTLMLPTASVMDLSIGVALYFASRAQGHLCQDRKKIPYTSPAKVLISGLGADELLGGYSRHRQAYIRASLPGLISELQLDLDRLPERNLGRDDRILSTHAKEARYPYLDRTVIEFLTSIPVESKVDLRRIATEGAGGDKRLLRDLAKQLGLQQASELKKRAMQFGTRSAKIDADSAKSKGHHKLN
ncbi:uncharacterized protein MEPE_04692 [Melanopsichium pennsylvanicum]|uniref:Glutamine amidotransferase type-2 domain-containing protein n=2 Tax=Melanopsichium pennsylvanicum TaxID=63383 RepID=A0AAJ4XPK4_9BASI|nr:asparagine synthetase [Melanopsichium pennsylvanicum 4]SNX85983.1 uncharacterized protein MEPE_04692 [Melanopsichium pennsylvanicum]